jgi:DNA polymerase I
VRNPMMRDLIRRVFVARDGRSIVERDFSGVEVRMACAYTHDPRLIKEFTGPGGDPHGDTAAQLFLLPKDQIDKKTLRDSAKNQFVFPQFYGSVAFQCAPAIWEAMERRQFRVGADGDGRLLREHLANKRIKELGDCTPGAPTRPGTFVHLVKEVEDDFWQRRFKVYTQWKKDWYAEYCRRGWFPLYTGFVCRGYYRRNQVLNYAIQGSAFHCLLWSLIEIDKEIRRRGMKTLLVGQVHDSLLADVPDGEVQEYLDLSQEVMSERLPKHWSWINVPIDTEVDVTPVGGSWLDKAEWVRRDGRWRPSRN